MTKSIAVRLLTLRTKIEKLRKKLGIPDPWKEKYDLSVIHFETPLGTISMDRWGWDKDGYRSEITNEDKEEFLQWYRKELEKKNEFTRNDIEKFCQKASNELYKVRK